ncbi:MAG: MarR family transcriptional regulator [Balneolaceae bacterium]|nr:MarR family transcriptional regulator [Balneolaceae bacterium]
MNQKSLGEKLLKSGGNITMVIDNLERCGYVERHRDPDDRRSVLIHLTDEGKSFIESFFPKHLEAIKEEFSVLTRKEKEQLADICKKLGSRKVTPIFINRLPIQSLIKHRQRIFDQLLQVVIGSVLFGRCFHRFFCVSFSETERFQCRYSLFL